jgi:acetyl-CoA C-acetyltransferase
MRPRSALEKAGLQPGDIDLWEINEAFASVTLNSMPDARTRRGPRERQRRRGRDRAPARRVGARILGTLVHELRRRGGGYGCAAICSGGGQGDAVIVKV